MRRTAEEAEEIREAARWMLAEGWMNREVAAYFGVSPATVTRWGDPAIEAWYRKRVRAGRRTGRYGARKPLYRRLARALTRRLIEEAARSSS